MRPFLVCNLDERGGESLNRKRNLWISLIAGLLSCLLVYGVYILQIRQVELQRTINVAVPKSFIEAGTILTSELIKYRPIAIGSYQVGMITDFSESENHEAMVPLGTGEPILSWKLDKFHLLPEKGQATFQIPKEYILSISNGIRAGDLVDLYISGAEGASERLFSKPLTVASVKSAANIEVDDAEHSNLLSKANSDLERMYVSRRNANGTIDQINLNLTAEEWLKIDQLCKTGENKLVLAFTSMASGTREQFNALHVQKEEK